MAVFGMFNIVMLAIGLIELSMLGACGIIFIFGCFRRDKTLIIVSLVVPAFLIGSLMAISYYDDANVPFPPQVDTPDEKLIPGTYVLDPSSFDYLKSRGFENLSATIELDPNGTFKVAQMPHIWIDGSPEAKGYDQCSGTWSIGRDPNNDHCYNVTMEGEKSVFPMGAVFLNISAPKGARRDYALQVPIFYGDFDYIYFVRQTVQNKVSGN